MANGDKQIPTLARHVTPHISRCIRIRDPKHIDTMPDLSGLVISKTRVLGCLGLHLHSDSYARHHHWQRYSLGLHIMQKRYPNYQGPYRAYCHPSLQRAPRASMRKARHVRHVRKTSYPEQEAWVQMAGHCNP